MATTEREATVLQTLNDRQQIQDSTTNNARKYKENLMADKESPDRI